MKEYNTIMFYLNRCLGVIFYHTVLNQISKEYHQQYKTIIGLDNV